MFFVWVCGCYADIKKMPLGKLSKMQIAKGFEVLEEIEAAMKQKKTSARLQELSSKFFTTVPHNFGRNRPPTINTQEIIDQKKEMLMVRFSFLDYIWEWAVFLWCFLKSLSFFTLCKGAGWHWACPDSEVRDWKCSGRYDRDSSSYSRPGLQISQLQPYTNGQEFRNVQGTVS